MMIKVVRDRSSPMRHIVEVGRHRIATDLGAEAGGGDSGPSPHDLYDAALGACKALTVLWYAQRSGIPVEGIELSVERDASEERTGTYRLHAALSLSGNLSAEQRAQLRKVAQKCPVHKLMTTVTTEITTTLRD